MRVKPQECRSCLCSQLALELGWRKYGRQLDLMRESRITAAPTFLSIYVSHNKSQKGPAAAQSLIRTGVENNDKRGIIQRTKREA